MTSLLVMQQLERRRLVVLQKIFRDVASLAVEQLDGDHGSIVCVDADAGHVSDAGHVGIEAMGQLDDDLEASVARRPSPASRPLS